MGDKHFLVVGGSSGIGFEMVKLLREKGHAVTVLSRSEKELSSLSGVKHVQVDVVKDEIDAGMLPDAIHGIAYCPGSINLKQFRSLKPDDFREDFEINVIGAVKVLTAARVALKKAGHAGIVLFSTVAVFQGMPFHASVAAAKGAIEGLMKALAAEWAPKIRVNCIAPSLTDTPMAHHLISKPERRDASDKRHPLRRIGKPEEIAGLAAYLLSEEAAWITGQVFGIDGGLSTLRV